MENIFIILLSLSLVGIGFLSWINNPKGNTNRYFFLFLFSTAFWVVFNYLSNTLGAYTYVLWSNRLIFTFTSLLAWSLYIFSVAYPNSKLLISPPQKRFFEVITFIVVIISLSPFLVSDVQILNDRSEITFNWGISIYLLHFLSFFVGFVIQIVGKYKRSKGLERIKIQYLSLGLVFSSIGAMTTNLILPVFLGDFSFSDFGPAFMLIFVGFTFVSIVKHRLLGIKFVLGSIFEKLILAILPVVGIYLFQILLSNSTFLPYSLVGYSVLYFFSITFVVIYDGYSKWIHKGIEKAFDYSDNDLEVIKNRIAQEVSETVDLISISETLSEGILEYLDVEHVHIYVLKNGGNHPIIVNKISELDISPKELSSTLLSYQKASLDIDDVVLYEEYKFSHKEESDIHLRKILEFMNRYQFEFFLPIQINTESVAFILSGPKYSKQAFTIGDITFLKYLSYISKSAYLRSLLYQKVTEFNKTLQSKINNATKNLNEKNATLEALRAKERDMMDIMGHELRTPLSIIRMKLSAYRRKMDSTPEKCEVKDFEELSTTISEALHREVELLETMLSSTKIDAKRMEITLGKVQLKKIIDVSIMAYSAPAADKKLELIFKGVSDDLYVFADGIRLGEVVDNYVSNAIKYTEKGNIVIDVLTEGDFVRISVKDSGIGIPEEALKRLGEKFFRVNQYIESSENGNPEANIVRPGGTGLGLYVTFGLVAMMGGKVDVQSEVGKGSTFSFTIPKYKDQKSKHEGHVKKNVFERMKLESELNLKK